MRARAVERQKRRRVYGSLASRPNSTPRDGGRDNAPRRCRWSSRRHASCRVRSERRVVTVARGLPTVRGGVVGDRRPASGAAARPGVQGPAAGSQVGPRGGLARAALQGARGGSGDVSDARTHRRGVWSVSLLPRWRRERRHTHRRVGSVPPPSAWRNQKVTAAPRSCSLEARDQVEEGARNLPCVRRGQVGQPLVRRGSFDLSRNRHIQIQDEMVWAFSMLRFFGVKPLITYVV